MTAPARSRSLTRQTLIAVAIRIAFVVVVATAICYAHVYASLQAQTLEQLREYIDQRGLRESSLFLLARDNLRLFARDYAEQLTASEDADSAARLEESFEELFERLADGNMRLRERYFVNASLSGVLDKRIDLDSGLRVRLALGVDMLSRYGPAWRNRFVNLYLTTPESAVLMYWPGKPWGLNANSWEVNARLALTAAGGDEVLVIADQQSAPRVAGWSDLYFDYAVRDWVLSAVEPINRKGRFIAAVGHDILLHDLIEQTIQNRLEGTYNLIFRDDGRLIVHPRFMDAIQAQSGQLSIPEAGDANLQRIFELVIAHADGTEVIENDEDGEYLAVTRLRGPDWYFVTVFPKAIIAERALTTARLILILGAVALVLEIAILFFVLRRKVAQPLDKLMAATGRVAAGDFAFRLDETRDDEIGRLARSFNTMSREIDARETTLSERSDKLTQVNKRLARELEERERAEREIARQREALHQSEKLNALGSLLAGVAHELNNPLSVVVGRSIMLEEGLRGTPQASNAIKIRAAAERCGRIVKTFLAMARQQKPMRARVRLRSIVDAALELVGYGLRADGVEVSVDFPEDLPELPIDSDQLTQVFTNLLLNAQQALIESANPRRIVVSARFDRGSARVRVRVSDNGPGIPADVVSRVFDPFFTTKAVGKGTGIGLAVSQGIVQAHGGTLALAPPELGGATFELTLPLDAAATAPAAALPDDIAAAEGCAILIVDDEPEIGEILADILTAAGYRTETVGSGRAALQKLESQRFDLIVSDLRMPDMDGKALFAELTARRPNLCNRIIFVTGDTLNEASRQFLQKAARPVIEKPFMPDEIRDTVARELQRLSI